MILEYLEDIEVASYEVLDLNWDKDGSAVAFLLTQILGFPHRHGLGKVNSGKAISAVPNLLKVLYGDLEVLGSWIKDHNQTIFGTRFSRKFSPTPYFRLKSLHKALGKTELSEDEEELPGGLHRYVQSGRAYFQVYGKFAKSSGGKELLGATTGCTSKLGLSWKYHRATRESFPHACMRRSIGLVVATPGRNQQS